ncbi:unnamed protein product [Sphacelaria rigidula]
MRASLTLFWLWALAAGEPSPSVPGPDAPLFQAATEKIWEQKRPTATIFTAESHRRIPQDTSCAHQKCHTGAIRLALSSEGCNGSKLFKFMRTAEISTCVPMVCTNKNRHHLSTFYIRSAGRH